MADKNVDNDNNINLLDKNVKLYPLRKRSRHVADKSSSDEGDSVGVVEEENKEEVEQNGATHQSPVDGTSHVVSADNGGETDVELDVNYNSDDLVSDSSDDEDAVPVGNVFGELFDTPWSGDFIIPSTNVNGLQSGPKNIPNTINGESTPLDFMNLFIGDDIYGRLCYLTNPQADRVRVKYPNLFILCQNV